MNALGADNGRGQRQALAAPAPVGPRAGADPRVEAAVEALLVALGLDVSTPGLRETPRRVAQMYHEMLTPRPFAPTTFPNLDGYDEMVLTRDVAVGALCEHHLLPFVGVAHIAYVPRERIIGLSKLARVVEFCSRRPQLQERLTVQIADWLEAELAPRGAGVIIDAHHLCMAVRGVKRPETRTTTRALRGLLRDDPTTRHEFLRAAGRHAA